MNWLRTYRHHLLALLGYLVLTLAMTYPLARSLGQAIPGDGFDGWQNFWNLWWIKRSLLVLRTSPYFTYQVYYPTGAPLYFQTLNIFNGLTFYNLAGAFTHRLKQLLKLDTPASNSYLRGLNSKIIRCPDNGFNIPGSHN